MYRSKLCIIIGNLDIFFSLFSTKIILSVYKLALIMNIICQFESKHIMTLPTDTITSVLKVSNRCDTNDNVFLDFQN